MYFFVTFADKVGQIIQKWTFGIGGIRFLVVID
jgi:hypothetical protein